MLHVWKQVWPVDKIPFWWNANLVHCLNRAQPNPPKALGDSPLPTESMFCIDALHTACMLLFVLLLDAGLPVQFLVLFILLAVLIFLVLLVITG